MDRFKRYGRGHRKPGEMNKLETKYSAFLDGLKRQGEILWFQFESVKLRLADRTFYTPDFFVMTADGTLEVHEVKGTSKGKPWVEDDAAVKIKVAADQFPLKFKMIWLVKTEWQLREY